MSGPPGLKLGRQAQPFFVFFIPRRLDIYTCSVYLQASIVALALYISIYISYVVMIRKTDKLFSVCPAFVSRTTVPYSRDVIN